jgi:glutamate/tyrosine decarboxylase-like PLP-dependent enzyme
MTTSDLGHKYGLLEKSFERIHNYLAQQQNGEQKLVEFKLPNELKQLINFEIGQKPVDEAGFLKLADDYLQYAVDTGNKQFLNQLYSGFNLPAFIGELFTSLTNTSMYTYEVAPVASLIESEMIRLMNAYAGYTNGDGIFLTGGSNANLMAMLSARNRLLPEYRFEGYDNSMKLTAFVNEHAHYSFDTAANITGMGSKNVIKVKTDAHGRMIPQELVRSIEESIQRDETPFFVAATCATTMLGAYDPIEAIAAVCQKHNLWLHADGAFGGSALLSEKHRHLLKGIEQTDSFSWNPHKLMNIPLICSVLLVKERGSLQHNITDIDADYIYHEIDETEDLGKKSVQCGRRVDAVKLWFAWKYYGLDGYRDRIDNLMDMAAYAEQKVNSERQLEMMSARQSFTVCFRYKPHLNTDLNAFNLQIREQLRKSGSTMVNYGYLGQELVIRLVTANAALEKHDIDKFFNLFLKKANELEQQLKLAL